MALNAVPEEQAIILPDTINRNKIDNVPSNAKTRHSNRDTKAEEYLQHHPDKNVTSILLTRFPTFT